tara:strand:+ start:451 stop:609 length:159 start_codon:yes stop_codon:yes gene_type:complete
MKLFILFINDKFHGAFDSKKKAYDAMAELSADSRFIDLPLDAFSVLEDELNS